MHRSIQVLCFVKEGTATASHSILPCIYWKIRRRGPPPEPLPHRLPVVPVLGAVRPGRDVQDDVVLRAAVRLLNTVVSEIGLSVLVNGI